MHLDGVFELLSKGQTGIWLGVEENYMVQKEYPINLSHYIKPFSIVGHCYVHPTNPAFSRFFHFAPSVKVYESANP